MTGSQSIDYEALQQEAMRNVVRSVLARAAKSGLPGDHHFYISFDTTAPGVSLSKRLKEKYPAEMTIVLQHRFWDLLVTEERFEVKLTFDGIPERLVVPFQALKVFIDPSVRYGLQFEDRSAADNAIGAANALDDEDDRPRMTRSLKKPRQVKKPRVVETESGKDGRGVETASPPDLAEPPQALPARVNPSQQSKGDTPIVELEVANPDPASDRDREGPPAVTAVPNGAQIVSLDQFRKK